MKIISLTRLQTVGLPTNYIVGTVPTIEGQETNADDPVVKSIVFFQEGAYSQTKAQLLTFKAFLGPCYLVSFVDSPIKRIIPAEQVVDVAVDSEPEKKEVKQAGVQLVEAAEDEASAIPET